MQRKSAPQMEPTHEPLLARQLRADALKQVILNRRSVRQFSEQPIEEDVLRDILQAGVYAPSGSNAQNQRFLLITDPAELARIGAIRFVWPYPNAGKMRTSKPSGLIGGSRAAIIVFADAALSDSRDNGEYHIWEVLEIQNCAAAIQNMLLMATALGIGSCWISASSAMSRTRLLSELTWRETLSNYDIPQTCKIQGIVILGHPRSRLDDAGFPVGEKEHGASIWSSTERQPLDHYLLKAPKHCGYVPELTPTRKLTLRLLSQLMNVALAAVRGIDRLILRLERPFLPKR